MQESTQDTSQNQTQPLENFELTQPKPTEETQQEIQEEQQPQIDPYEKFASQHLQCLLTLETPSTQLLTCCLDPQGDHLCVGSDKGDINIYSTKKPKALYSIKSGEPCNCLRYVNTSISGHLLLSCSPGQQNIELWHTTSERLLKRFENHGAICIDSCLGFADYFCAGGYDGLIREYSLEKNQIIEYKTNEWLTGHSNRVMCIKTVGQVVLSCAWDEVLYLWDRRTARSVDCCTGVRAFGTDAITILNDGKTIGIANYRDFSQLQLLSLSDLKLKRQNITWEQYNPAEKIGLPYAIKNLANDDLVVGSAGDNQIRVFKKEKGYECVGVERNSGGEAVYSIDVKGELVAAVGQNGLGKVLKL